MRVQAYTIYGGTIQITIATQRIEPMPSTKFTSATMHEEYAATVGAYLREHKHTAEATALQYPAAKRLPTYLPTHNGAQLYRVMELVPSGTARDVDDPWQLEITRIRYAFVINLLPAAFIADEVVAEAIMRNMEYAFNRLLVSNGVPAVFIPGDQELRLGEGTEIDIVCELGGASGRMAVEVPAPAQS